MLWRFENFIAAGATALAFAYCGWFIAGDPGAAVSAVLSLAMFLRPPALGRQKLPSKTVRVPADRLR